MLTSHAGASFVIVYIRSRRIVACEKKYSGNMNDNIPVLIYYGWFIIICSLVTKYLRANRMMFSRVLRVRTKHTHVDLTSSTIACNRHFECQEIASWT